MRLFIAIDLNFEMKEELLYLSSQIKANSEKCSVTKQDNLHLTLAFIGESNEKDKIISALRNVSFPEFSLTLQGLGSFSNRGEKLVYAAMRKNNTLLSLQKDISNALKNNGIDFDKKAFKPHITIARRTVPKNGFEISSVKPQEISSPVKAFYLYSSDLSGRAPVYTKLAEFGCR